VFDVWIVPCFPESPYWNATANPTFLERANSWFQHGSKKNSGPLGFADLTEPEQAIVCWLSCGQVPPEYTTVPHDDVDVEYVQAVEHRLKYDLPDGEIHRSHLVSTLPDRYLVDQRAIYTPGKGNAVRETLRPDSEETTQASFGALRE
jgi:hypothetical protein